MTTKTCYICEVEKPVELFYNNASRKGGYDNRCIECDKAKGKKYRETHKELVSTKQRAYYVANKERIDKQQREYVTNNRDKVLARGREYRANNAERERSRQREYHLRNKDVVNEKHRAYYKRNKETETVRRVAYNKNRTLTDPNFRLHTNFRNLARKFFTSDSRNVADHRLVSKRTLERWISFQRMLNDAPDNYHLDERWPNSKFNLEDPYHCLVATNVLNFCPMDPIENIRKSNKILPELLLDHLNVADTFVNSEEHSKQEALKLRYLYDMYSNFVYKQLEILLNDSGILNNEVQE